MGAGSGKAKQYEKLGSFYLGSPMEGPSGEPRSEPFLYDAKDLTTHAVCVGMTGSGKTGLAISLIEEAAIDGIPVIAIDPKGDLGNLMLTFPELRADDFRPWIDEGDAARKGRTPDEHAQWTADLWRKGLAGTDQSPERIARFAGATERTVYTPGSESGRPLSILKSFVAPSEAVLADGDAMRERVLATTSGLLALLGIAADPIRSREHILLSTLFDRAWRQHQHLDLPTLIQQIQSPPITRIGVMELNTFYPAKDRFELSMAINSLIASPGFAAWSSGDPLDVGHLLYTQEGRPRLSIISISHLSDSERMFLVTSLLNEVVAWMRSQPGSRTLRAILYMDEVFGYLPPTANPPSKVPMLTLLKQARAYGLGVVLATQNPVDLDYKALSNAGTWFLGRLQTERDKARVLEGLEGATASAGKSFDAAEMERTLAGLDSRVFLMNNVHEDRPTIFHTRWALSYLAGPLTRSQIKDLATDESDPGQPADKTAPAATQARPTAPAPQVGAVTPSARPILPDDIVERFAPIVLAPEGGRQLVYRPALWAAATLHFTRSNLSVDTWSSVAVRATLKGSTANPWTRMEGIGEALPDLARTPPADGRFETLRPAASDPKSYTRWKKSLQTQLYRTRQLDVFRCADPKLVATLGEPEGQFRGRLCDHRREQRDLAIEKLRSRYAPTLAALEKKIESAVDKVDVETEQYSHQRNQTLISIGATVVGALFGRKLTSASGVGRATTAARSFGRASRERGDIERAEERVEELQNDLQELEKEFEAEVARMRDDIDPASFDVETVVVRPRKSDLAVDQLLLVWEPWNVDPSGTAEPAFHT